MRNFAEEAFRQVGNDIVWDGEGVNELGRDKLTNKVLIRIDPKYYRPTEVDCLIGDSKKAKKILGWEAKISFEELVKEMVNFALNNSKE